MGHYLLETNQSREWSSLCGRKGVGFYFHKSHSINTFSIIIEHWLHKFCWLISCLFCGCCCSLQKLRTHHLWTCRAPYTSEGGRTGTGSCSLCPPRSSSAGDTGSWSHWTGIAERSPASKLYYCGVSRVTLVIMTHLASLTRDHAVVDTAGLVSTHLAGDDLNLCCKKKGL